MTRIAITAEGPTLQDRVDPRFGRAGGFVLIDTDSNAISYVDNGTSQTMAQGAGIQAAENIVKAGAEVLLTGHVGPKAHAALQAAGIRMGQGLDNLTVGEALERYKNGQVDFSAAPSRA